MTHFSETMMMVLKFFAIFLGTAATILALFIRVRRDGQITFWGRVAIIGGIFSFLVSISLEFLQSKDDSEKTEAILKEIDQGIFAIRPSELSFDATINAPDSLKLLQAFITPVKSMILEARHNHRNLNTLGIEFLYDNSNVESDIYGVRIYPQAKVYPSNCNFANVLNNFAIDIEVAAFNQATDALDSDFSLDFTTETILPIITYNAKTHVISFQASTISVAEDDYATNNKGRIVSLTDLSKAKIWFGYCRDGFDKASEREEKELIKSMRIVEFNINAVHRKIRILPLASDNNEEGPVESYASLPDSILYQKTNVETMQP